MATQYEYQVVKIYYGTDEESQTQGYFVEADFFKAFTQDTLDRILVAIPNLMQEREKGGWETYGTLFVGTTIMFLIRRQTVRILTPQDFAYYAR